MSWWKFLGVEGAGHDDPAKYFPYVKRWAAGEDNAGRASGDDAH
jgi:hypothetical protein